MRVCLIIPSFYPATNYGGPIVSSYNTSRHLAKQSQCQIFVSTTDANRYTNLEVDNNKYLQLDDDFHVKYYHENIRERFSFAFFCGIWRDIAVADIVHIQAIFNYTTVISLIWSKLLNKPTVLTPRGCLGSWAFRRRNTLKLLWCYIFIKPFSKFVHWHATSHQEEAEINHLFPGASITVIPNGVDINEYKSPTIYTRQQLVQNFTDRYQPVVSKIIVSVGRLHAKKGFDVLIMTFNKILEQYPDSYLLIAGPDGGERKSLLALISKLGLENNIHLLGEVHGSDKISLYASADVFALPSHNENYGNVYVESLAAGTPIVASLNTPWSDVEKLGCGLWVENSVDQFSEAILEIFSHDRSSLSVKCRTYAASKDWKYVALKFNNLFEELLEKDSI